MDGELKFEPSSLRLPTVPFHLIELLGDTGCATAERGVLVKDRTEIVIVVTVRTGLPGETA